MSTPRRARRVAFAYRFAAATLRVLPARPAYRLAAVAGEVGYRRSTRQRAIVAANLGRVVGLEPGDRELEALVRRCYEAYARYWVDACRIDLADVEGFARRFEMTGTPHLEAAFASGRGVILALPHLGSWEIGGMYGQLHGHPFAAVAEVLEPADLFEWFVAERARIGLEVIAADRHATAHVLRILEHGGTICLVADRDLTGSGVPVEFFGAPTTLPGGPALLALRSGAVLLPCAIYQRPDGGARAVVRGPIDTARSGSLRADVAAVTARLAAEFEALIAVAPEQWHVFQPVWPEPAPRGGR